MLAAGAVAAAGRGPGSPSPGEVLALQRTAGNAAVQRLVAGGGFRAGDVQRSAKLGSSDVPANDIVQAGTKSGGEPLAPAVRERMEPRFGHDFGDVRVHTGSVAQRSAQALDAKAYTVGTDVVFGAGEYAPGTGSGDSLLAHELAHVVQQRGAPAPQGKLEISDPGDPLETEADTAAAAVVGGGSATLTSGAGRVSRFAQGTTQIRDGQYQGGTGHAGMTEEALHGMGLTPEQARAGRFGNWERDLSQALTPGTIGMISKIMPILNILAIKEFGRGIDIHEFGTYDPVEHIDNPAGLRASDVFEQTDPADASRDFENQMNPDAGAGAAGTEGRSDMGQAMRDRRYAETKIGKVERGESVAAFQVDQSAIPRYMQTSREWLKGKMHTSARLGREADGQRGPREFASGIHTMQDYYAHSNFCEIAINSLIRSGGLEIAVGGDNDHPVMQAVARGQSLDTMMHRTGDMAHNARLRSGREVMTTGTFNLTDTVASVLEEVNDKLKGLNPFAEKGKGPSALTAAVLDYMEMDESNPTQFNAVGQTIAQGVRGLAGGLSPFTTVASAVVEGAGEIGAGAVRGAGSVASGVLGGLSWINEQLGGSANYFGEEQAAVHGATEGAARGIEGVTTEAAEAVRGIITSLEEEAASWENEQHLLRRAYGWLYEHNPIDALKEAAKRIPVIGERVAAIIESVHTFIRDKLEEILGAAWNGALDLAVEAVNAVINQVRAGSNIQEQRHQSGEGLSGKFGGLADMYDEQGRPKAGIAPSGFEPPSHTQIAKDHAPITNPVHDQERDPDETHGDEHGHQHLSSYLATLASRMGSKASAAVGRPVADCWDKVARGQEVTPEDLQAIDRVVDHWFAHPDDCRDTWEGDFRSMLRDVRVGTEVAERLGAH